MQHLPQSRDNGIVPFRSTDDVSSVRERPGTGRDTTAVELEHFRTQAALKRSEERFRAIVEFASDAMIIVDHLSQIVLVNTPAENLFGYRRKEILGQPLEWLIPERFRDAFANHRNHCLSSPHPGSMSDTVNLTACRKDDREIPVEVSFRPLQADGVTLFAAKFRSISDRRPADDELTSLLAAVDHQRMELQMILDSVPALIFYKDIQCRLIHVNQALADSYGLPREHIEGKTDAELGSPYARQYLQDDLTVLTTGKPLRGLVEQFHTPAGTRWIQTEKVPHHDLAGNIIGLVGIAVDITEKKQLEEQLRQSQKLEAIGQLASGVAHDFNNLLTVINGYSEILLESVGPDGALSPLLQEINKAGERAARLTHQLLAFSRKQVLEPQALDLNTRVIDMEKMLCRLIGADIELRTELAANLGQVVADPGQLEQVMLNLAVNARDAMPKGGRLTIETARLSVTEIVHEALPKIPPGSYVLLTVRDTGCGMDARTKACIFEPFFTTKEPGKGTGLGLATVYGIVAQSGGHILVDTEVGAGTAFQIYFPHVHADVADSRSSTCPAPSRHGNETVLLADDDENVRELARRILQANGYQVLEAKDGQAALRVAQTHSGHIHLLVTDLVMPHLCGGDLANQLNLIRPTTKVLFLSGYAEDVALRQDLVTPHAPLLHKPFTPKSLALKVRDVLDQVV